MALSGSKTVAFCSRNGANRYYLKWTWSATQNVANNQSTVTVKGYIGSYGNGYAISSSATKSGTITINGTSYSFSSSTAISSGGSRQIVSKTVTINHNADGTKTFGINMSFNPAVTISGTYQGNVTMGATNYTLNQIPRASSFSSTAGWKFPNNKTISISRKSSSFTHTVRIYVGGTLIKTFTKTSSVSFSTAFTTAENTTIAGKFAQGSSASVEMQLDTYSGNTKIGSTASITGTLSIYGRSTTTFTNNWNIGSTISGKITENASGYTHTLQLLRSDASTVICTILNKSGTLDWSYTPTASTLYALTPNSNSYTGRIRLYTYYNGVQIGSYAQSNITFKVANSNPTFAPTLTYYDNNATIKALTGDQSYIVQNKSNLFVEAYGQATAINSATMSQVTCTVAGVTKTGTWNSTAGCYVFNFGTINASSNQSAVVKAIDSRGNSTSKSLTIKCLPYVAPKLTASVERANKFSTTVSVGGNGTLSGVVVNGSPTNTINSASYTVSIDGGTATSNDLSVGSTSTTFSITEEAFTLSETSIATVIVTIGDKYGGTASATVSVPTGLPIIFIDAEKGNISFNALPDMTREANMKIGMQVDTASNQYWTNGTAGTTTFGVEGNYGIDMKNSDLVGLGGIFFNDVCEAGNHNEGIYWVNSGNMRTAGDSNHKWFSRMYMRDGQVWIGTNKGDSVGNGSVISPICIGNALNGLEKLWEGTTLLNASTTVTPKVALNNCSNGWVLVWSDFNPTSGLSGAITDTQGSNANYDWNFTIIPKASYVWISSSQTINIPIAAYLSSTGSTLTTKQIYVSRTNIKGHANNAITTSGSTDVCLRYVFMI